MEVHGIIYKITCSDNNKSYIGQTIKTMKERWNDHQRDFKRFQKYKKDKETENSSKKRNFCTYLYNAINKYGIDKFNIEEVAQARNKEELDKLETENIIKFNTISPYGFNLTSGGEGGWKFSKDTLEKISKNTKIGIAKNIDKLRKNEHSKGLPVHCIFTKIRSEEAYLIQKHSRCYQKEFKISKYGSRENAKQAMLNFLENLEKTNTVYLVPKVGGNEIPKGIMKTNNNKYRVKKCINGIRYVKDFNDLENAKEFLNKVLSENIKQKIK